ncbi:MAG: germination protein YpeB [Oscillospiraceae bacterium]|nr:germination protein YpeB [Oscillospiraceae bacterium]
MSRRKMLSKRGAIRTVSYTLALISVLSAFVYINYREAQSYKWHMESGYQHSFGELVESIDKINSSLQKGRYAKTAGMVATLSNEVSRNSALAVSALSGLPFSHIELERTAKFLCQIGDYSYALTKKDAEGQGITEAEAASMSELADAAFQLSQNLRELYQGVLDGSLSVNGYHTMEAASEMQPGSIDAMSDSLSEMELQFPEYAGLIYDGPFSEHITARKPVYLENLKEVDSAYATGLVAKLLDIPQSSVQYAGVSGDTMPVHNLSVNDGENFAYIDVTVQGGKLVDMMNSKAVGEAALSAEQCVEKAKEFMKRLELESMTESYYFIENNICTINYAYSENDTIFYPDLAKVCVAMDDGEILGYECRGYLMNHKTRELPAVKVSEAEAREKLSSDLTVDSVRLAVIPSPGQYEKLCHEFKCSDGTGQQYLIYVSVETGNEEQILILIESENGTLTI